MLESNSVFYLLNPQVETEAGASPPGLDQVGGQTSACAPVLHALEWLSKRPSAMHTWPASTLLTLGRLSTLRFHAQIVPGKWRLIYSSNSKIRSALEMLSHKSFLGLGCDQCALIVR